MIRPVYPRSSRGWTFARSPDMLGKLILALSLASGIPLLVAAYGLYASTLNALDSARTLSWVLSLLVVAGVSAVVGGIMLWRLASGAGRTAAVPGSPPPRPVDADAAPDGMEPVADESREDVATLMDTFSRALTSIEQQAAEITQYTSRLDSAYKEIETSSARLKEFSFKDEVTGLYNRRFFSIRLEEEVSRYRRFDHPVSVVLLDLDGFKAVNDELGHAAGDETLRGMAEILLKNSRGINVICRYGGDEFAILLVETSKAGARLYADRIRDIVPTSRFSHGRQITASFGIASLPEDAAPAPDELIRAADEALYAAKRAGKNRVFRHGEGTSA
jgi:diguanylate cyclase (GGDEF)-like protein